MCVCVCLIAVFLPQAGDCAPQQACRQRRFQEQHLLERPGQRRSGHALQGCVSQCVKVVASRQAHSLLTLFSPVQALLLRPQRRPPHLCSLRRRSCWMWSMCNANEARMRVVMEESIAVSALPPPPASHSPPPALRTHTNHAEEHTRRVLALSHWPCEKSPPPSPLLAWPFLFRDAFSCISLAVFNILINNIEIFVWFVE